MTSALRGYNMGKYFLSKFEDFGLFGRWHLLDKLYSSSNVHANSHKLMGACGSKSILLLVLGSYNLYWAHTKDNKFVYNNKLQVNINGPLYWVYQVLSYFRIK